MGNSEQDMKLSKVEWHKVGQRSWINAARFGKGYLIESKVGEGIALVYVPDSESKINESGI